MNIIVCAPQVGKTSFIKLIHHTLGKDYISYYKSEHHMKSENDVIDLISSARKNNNKILLLTFQPEVIESLNKLEIPYYLAHPHSDSLTKEEFLLRRLTKQIFIPFMKNNLKPTSIIDQMKKHQQVENPSSLNLGIRAEKCIESFLNTWEEEQDTYWNIHIPENRRLSIESVHYLSDFFCFQTESFLNQPTVINDVTNHSYPLPDNKATTLYKILETICFRQSSCQEKFCRVTVNHEKGFVMVTNLSCIHDEEEAYFSVLKGRCMASHMEHELAHEACEIYFKGRKP